VYDLATGKVLSWCPKNTLARQVLGGLKDKTEPQDLPVYPVQLRPGGKVAVKFI
jgi:nitrite reductase/ring-hydroxylating ferredoxin subunit